MKACGRLSSSGCGGGLKEQRVNAVWRSRSPAQLYLQTLASTVPTSGSFLIFKVTQLSGLLTSSFTRLLNGIFINCPLCLSHM